jgi:hypothetical protein
MADKDTRNFDPQTGKGMTAQEIADKAAGYGGQPHPSAAAAPTRPVGPNIHPVAKGVYGAPVGPAIFKQGSM